MKIAGKSTTLLEGIIRDSIALMLSLQGMHEIDFQPVHDVEFSFDKKSRYVGAHVHILGDWLGTVRLIFSHDFLSKVSSLWYDEDKNSLRAEQKQELMKELANLVGGNLKPVLGDRCILSIPKFLGAVNELHQDSCTLCFQYQSDMFLVEIYEDKEVTKSLKEVQ